MLWLKRLFKFYINASIHVALAVSCLYLVSVQMLNIMVNLHLLGFLFFSTVVCYNFVKYGVEAEKYLIVAKPAHKPIQIFSFLAFGFALYHILYLKAILWVVICCFSLVALLYAVPFLPQSRNLRSLGGLKIYVIAFVWMGFTLVLPLVDGELFGLGSLLFLVQRYVLVLVLMLPFEVRDLKYDPPGLRTIPQRIGVAKTKKIGYALVLVYLGLAVCSGSMITLNLILSAILGVLLVVVVYFTKKNRATYYASFWVEGVPVLWFLVARLLYWAIS